MKILETITLIFIFAILALSTGCSWEKDSGSPKAEVFTHLKSSVSSGLIFDAQANMYVAIKGELRKATPDGQMSTFCSLKEQAAGKNYYFESPLIWDMIFDSEGNILAAAQDRILSIGPDGKATTLIRKDFEGFLGASGLVLDQQGNLYVTDGGVIMRYTPDLEGTVFISEPDYSSFFSLAFDPEYKNLYVTDFHTKSVLQYAIDLDNNPSNPTVVVQNPVPNSGAYGAPLNMVFSINGNMYVSLDGVSQVLKIDPEGTIEFLKLGGSVKNHYIAFGTSGFEQESLYITTFNGNSVYKYPVGEGAAKR